MSDAVVRLGDRNNVVAVVISEKRVALLGCCNRFDRRRCSVEIVVLVRRLIQIAIERRETLPTGSYVVAPTTNRPSFAKPIKTPVWRLSLS